MSVQRMLRNGPLVPLEDIQGLIVRAQEHFDNLSEEDQILYLAAQSISYGLGLSDAKANKIELARHFLKGRYGPKFAERVLSDTVCREKLGL